MWNTYFTFISGWVKARFAERTSWDGGMLIACGVAFLLFQNIAVLASYAAIAYGIWTLWKSEHKS
jgi:hypothetical protein